MVFGPNGELLTTITESMYMPRQLPNGLVQLFKAFRGVVHTININSVSHSLPLPLAQIAGKHQPDNGIIAYYQFTR